MKKITSTILLMLFALMVNAQTTVDCTAAPITTNYCYDNNDTTSWLFTSTDGSPVRIAFSAGTIEAGWDELTIYDGADNTAPVLFNSEADGIFDFTGLTYDSTGDSIYLEVDSDGSVSCTSGSRDEWVFTASCATCVNPVATYFVDEDCINGPQFFVDVDLTDMGSASSITISDNQGSTPQIANAIGVYTFGPFPNNTGVVITVANDDDSNCTLTSPSLTQDQCVLNTIDCTQAPQQFNYCYDNNDDTAWLFTSTDGSPIRITFNAGGIESCCDDILIYDGTSNAAPLIYQGNNGGDLSGLTFDSTGDSLYFEIDADGSVSCASGSGCCTTEWDFTVACATCVNPVVDYAINSDCINGPQFFVDVDLTDLGSATSITITDNQGSAPQTTSATGMFSFGPFPNTTDVVITVTNDDDSNCILTSNALTQPFCLDNYIDCTAGPSAYSYCYENNDTNVFSYTSSDGSPLNLNIISGFVAWNGFNNTTDDPLIIYDSDGTTELYNGGGNEGDLAGLSFQSTGDTIYFSIQSNGFTSCESGSAGLDTGIDYTVSCATCVNPAVTYAVVQDCVNGPQFLVDVDLTDLGSATSITITDNQGSTPINTSATGLFTFGPFPNMTDVVITVASDDDANCTLTSTSLTQEQCVLNVIDCTAGPQNFNYCYDNNDDTTWLFASNDGSPVRIVFNAGGIESCCDDILIYDGADNTATLLYQGNNGGDLAGLVFQSTGDSLFMEIDADGSVSCASGSGCCTAEWDFTVSCATCTFQTVNYNIVDDCANGDQFFIDVEITDMGDAVTLNITDDQGSTPQTATATGTYTFGPFPNLTNVDITVENADDANCTVNSGPITQLACPPDNDECATATVAGVNDNALCTITTPGTILGATASNNPVGSCTGSPDDDVWFEFTALSEVHVISLLNINGGTGFLGHALYSGPDCDNLTEIYCVDDTSSLAISLIVGETYYLRVFSNTDQPDQTSTFDLCIRIAPENTECAGSSPFCADENGAIIFPNTTGIEDSTSIACLFTAPNPAWYFIQVQDPGEIVIDIIQNTGFDENGNPTGTGLDVDFVLWGPFAPGEVFCGNLDQGCPDPGDCPNNTSNPDFYPSGNIVDCSYSIQDVETLTIDNAQTAEIYVLVVTNFSDDPGFIQLVQTNGDQPGSGSTDCSILCDVDLGEDLDLCGYTTYTLTAESAYADYYEWYKDGIQIIGADTETLEITESGTYTVLINNDICEEPALDEIVVNFYQEPVLNPIEDIITCDDASGDEIEDFDLESQTAILLGDQLPSDFAVTYHVSLEDAQAGENPLTSPYTNTANPQTIYIRVEDVNAVGSDSGCFVTTSFNIEISGPTPTATSVDFPLCDDASRDGVEIFDLDSHSASILDGQDDTIFTVTYYLSETEAEDGNNPLTSPYENTSTPQTIYARVESNVATDCYSITNFNLIVEDVPYTTFDGSITYEVCPNATVPIEVMAIAENYLESEVSINWYQDGVLIPGQNNLILPTVLTEGVYSIEVTFNNNGCSYMTDVDVVELETCVIPQGISPDGDGLNDSFDLSSYDVHKLEIYNRYGQLVYSKENYSDEWVGQSDEGERLPVGTYFYVMRYQDNKQKAAWVYLNY